jgi:ABC-type sugar transport system substrate-binding protein
MLAKMNNTALSTSILLVMTLQFINALQFAIVPKTLAAEGFYGLARDGCEDRLRNDPIAIQYNISCLYRGSMQPDVQENLRIMNELIDDPDVFGISVSVLDTEDYTPVINRGVAEGKAIITFDSDARESDRLAYVGTNNYAMGTELAKVHMIQFLSRRLLRSCKSCVDIVVCCEYSLTHFVSFWVFLC